MAFVINYCEVCGARIEEPGQTHCKAHRDRDAVPATQVAPVARTPRPGSGKVPSPNQRIRRANSRRVTPITSRAGAAVPEGSGGLDSRTANAAANARRAGITAALVMVGALVCGGVLIALSGAMSSETSPSPVPSPGNSPLANANASGRNHGHKQPARNNSANGNHPGTGNLGPQPGADPAPPVDMTVEFRDGTILTGRISPGEVQLDDADGIRHVVHLASTPAVLLDDARTLHVESRSGARLTGTLPTGVGIRFSSADVAFDLDLAMVRRIVQPGAGSSGGSGAGNPGMSLSVARRLIDPTQVDQRIRSPKLLTFDRRPDGTPLRIGENINDAFVEWGCQLRTSLQGTWIAPNSFPIPVGSSGPSCASAQPEWRGITSIQFCKPGDAGTPAGVHCAGLWIAAVRPGGTTLEAWSESNRLIAAVTTTVEGVDYLGIQSPVPIVRVRVVPDPDIDPDYTIDDLTFDTPRMLPPRPVAGRLRVDLTSGDTVLCRSVLLRDNRLTALDTPVGAVLSWPADAVSSVAADDPGPPVLPATTFLVRTTDGSVLRATSEGGVVRAVLDGREMVAGRDLVAAWGARTVYSAPPPEHRPTNGQALIMDGRRLTRVPAGWRLANGYFTLPGPGPGPGAADPIAMSQAPMMWFGNEPTPRLTAGHLQLDTGDSLVLGRDGWRIREWTAREIVVSSATGASVKIPGSQVVRCVFPRD